MEPVTLEEVKLYLRIDGTDADPILNGLIQSAREYCETFQNRSYITQTWELVLDEFPWLPLSLPKPPLQSVVSIKCVNESGVETVWDPSNYVVDVYSEPGRIAMAQNGSWPSVNLQAINGVKIRFTSGYGTATDVPESIKSAIKVYVAHRFENPDRENVPKAVDMLLWQDRVVPV
jgi:uncharacterized phiE125 gp8 family phage protein